MPKNYDQVFYRADMNFTCFSTNYPFGKKKINYIMPKLRQGRIQPEVEEGAIWKGGAKKKMKSERAKGARKLFGLRSIKFSGFSSE